MNVLARALGIRLSIYPFFCLRSISPVLANCQPNEDVVSSVPFGVEIGTFLKQQVSGGLKSLSGPLQSCCSNKPDVIRLDINAIPEQQLDGNLVSLFNGMEWRCPAAVLAIHSLRLMKVKQTGVCCRCNRGERFSRRASLV